MIARAGSTLWDPVAAWDADGGARLLVLLDDRAGACAREALERHPGPCSAVTVLVVVRRPAWWGMVAMAGLAHHADRLLIEAARAQGAEQAEACGGVVALCTDCAAERAVRAILRATDHALVVVASSRRSWLARRRAERVRRAAASFCEAVVAG